MRFVFVMDPVETVVVDEDTSFALMREAQNRGHEVFHCLVPDVDLLDGVPRAQVRSATMSDQGVALGDVQRLVLGDVDAIFVRKDPPFDDAYLWLTLILERLRGQTLVINDPRGLREANEKLYACHFPELMPRTLVSANKVDIKEFVEDVGGQAVIKPVDGHGGHGIFALGTADRNLNAHIETVTQNGSRVAMVQAFIQEVDAGDKRILLIGSKIVGAILRVPRGGDLRSNIHVGGEVVATTITAEDRRICETLMPRLQHDGLYFVGLDVIGNKLTEVNVTSPTGIQQMSRLSGTNCEAPVIDWAEKESH